MYTLDVALNRMMKGLPVGHKVPMGKKLTTMLVKRNAILIHGFFVSSLEEVDQL